jgi:hypothetical protein
MVYEIDYWVVGLVVYLAIALCVFIKRERHDFKVSRFYKTFLNKKSLMNAEEISINAMVSVFWVIRFYYYIKNKLSKD